VRHVLLFSATMWNILVLCPILGITWVFGVLSVNNDLVAFQYIFAVANSLQVSVSFFQLMTSLRFFVQFWFWFDSFYVRVSTITAI